MRYLLYAIYIPLLLVLACSDDNGTDATPHPIVGNWVLQYGFIDSDRIEANEFAEVPYVLEFHSDGKLIMHQYEYGIYDETDEFTWSIVADLLTYTRENSSISANYTIIGDELTLTKMEGNESHKLVFKRS